MLLPRSILPEVYLLLVVSLVKAQYGYDQERTKAAESQETPALPERPDYYKLFAEGASVPVYDYSIFGPSQLDSGESNKQTVKVPSFTFFDEPKQENEKLQTYETKKKDYRSYDPTGPLKDFFEESEKKALQQQQSRDEEVIRPGPSYVSHQVPAYDGYGRDEDKSASYKAEENVAPEESKKTVDYGNEAEEGRVVKDEDDYKLPPFTFEPLLKNDKQKVNYDTGKSSSTVSQYPAAPESGNIAAAATPYVRYHYQPVTEKYQAQNTRIFDTLISTAEPYDTSYDEYSDPTYETQSSEGIPTKFQGKNGCQKVPSEDDMNCFVCHNEKTNAKYTQCNYKSQQEPVGYYSGTSSRYSMPHKDGNSGRYKRYAGNEDTDPYTLIKSRSLKAFDNPSIPADYGLGFQYEGENYDESKPEVSYSEQQGEALKKNPENCKQVDRKGMTCTVCLDPKTGGNFEQCSYTSAPKEKKYAYVTEKKYDNDEPEETKTIPETKTVELTGESKVKPDSSKNNENTEQYEGRVRQETSPRKRNEEGYDDYSGKSSDKQSVSDKGYEVPSHFSSVKSEGDHSGSSSESAENVDPGKSGKYDFSEDFSDFDEYHFKLFPEFAKQESRQEDVKENYQIPEATKQNVESVLAEFSKKDRSNCKKAEKKGMTCFLCVDKNNIQHEECMYVQESRPQSSHVAYHEAKAGKDQNGQPVVLKQPEYAESKRKHFFKKVTTPAPLTLQASASEEVQTVVRFNPEEEKREEKRISEDDKELKEAASDFDDESDRISDKGEPTIKTPAEFAVGAEEGVYSEETRPVFSKALGVKLPKYMLEKSEFEKEFDDFAGSF